MSRRRKLDENDREDFAELVWLQKARMVAQKQLDYPNNNMYVLKRELYRDLCWQKRDRPRRVRHLRRGRPPSRLSASTTFA